jgi:hypothetical protein
VGVGDRARQDLTGASAATLIVGLFSKSAKRIN